ncbi:MAG TPA: DNA-formamidopyrimidine glycosylase family protein [Nannocystaceae bacterium]|nr:DNA-formamidopyrimidine glycosylase family protein [Nannocystaceae bacterium]
MPEGDTIHRIANRIAPRLVGRTPARIFVRAHGEVLRPGMHIAAVEAVGKHLLVAVDPDRVLRIHLGMPGRIHRTTIDAVRIRDDTSAVVATDEDAFVWRNARDADWTSRGDPRFVQTLRRVGPDLLAPELEVADVVARARASSDPQRPMLDVLLDQSIASGVGNVFKSEVLFLRGLAPLTPISALDDAALAESFALARLLMQASMRLGTRDTIRAVAPTRALPRHERLWVYDRAGQPCRRCGTAVSRRAMGQDERVTFFCSSCQA